MVSAAAGILVAVVGLVGPELKANPAPEAARPIKEALERGKYPWYDPQADAARPVWPPREWDWSWLDRIFPDWKLNLGGLGILRVGELAMIGLALLALVILLVVLFELWRRYRPPSASGDRGAGDPDRLARIEGLPAGLRPETTDPWNEALRRRARGDLAGAVVCLFAHQLLTLDRLRMVRLVPGRTARQLVHAVADGQFRGWVGATLHLFESVYYGHRAPSTEAFEVVWSLAEAFERRAAAGPVA